VTQDPTSDTVEIDPSAPPLDLSDDGEEVPAVFAYDEKAPNLMPLFDGQKEGDEAIKKLADMVLEKWDESWDSCEEWRERTSKDWQLFAGNLPKKDFPFADCANVNIPMMMENTTRLLARVMDEIFIDDEKFFSAAPVTAADRVTADIVTTHDNWQFRAKFPDFMRQQERGLMSFLVMGDCTFHSFWNPVLKSNRHEVLTADEFVIPYVYTTTMPDYSDVPYKFRVLHYYRHELQAMQDDWFEVDKVLDRDSDGWDAEPETKLRDKTASTQGIVAPAVSKSAPRKLLHYEGWDDGLLPNQERDRFVKIVIDYQSKRILQLSIHETENWEDKLRFERQTQELESFRAATEQHAQAQGAAEQALASAQNPPPPAPGMMLPPPPPPEMLAQAQAAAQAPAPPPPSWLKTPEDPNAAPEKVRMEPIQMFAHGVCFENLVGALGLSYGRYQADLNRAANTSFNQFIDQATLGNCGTYITAGTIQFERPFTIRPGAINIAKGVTGQELKDGFVPLKPEPGNQQMQQIVQSLYGWAQSSMQAPGVLSGEAGKSGETWRGISARIEQATKQLSHLGKKYMRGPLRQVVLNNARLNSLYLPDFEIAEVAMRGTMVQLPVSRKMWERNYQIEFLTDMRFSTQAQRISETDEIVQLPQVVPALQQDLPFLHEVAKRALEVRGLDDLVPLLGPPPPPPMTPFGLPPPPPPGMAPPPGAEPPPPNQKPAGGPPPPPQGGPPGPPAHN
jgi:hypothetical protein